MTSVYFACGFQQGMQLHVIAAFQLCPIHAALSAPCGQTVSPATHHALQLELGGGGGRCWCFRFPEHLPLSHHLMVPYCCPDSEPHVGFSSTALLFQEQATWGVHESPPPPPPRPGRLPMDVIKGGFRKRLLAAAGPRPCCLTADGRQDSSSTTLHQRQI